MTVAATVAATATAPTVLILHHSATNTRAQRTDDQGRHQDTRRRSMAALSLVVFAPKGTITTFRRAQRMGGPTEYFRHFFQRRQQTGRAANGTWGVPDGGGWWVVGRELLKKQQQ